MAGRSIVEYFAGHEGYRCGYCGNTDTNYSHGMWAHTLTVQDYEDLIDRGWRRSGCYVYKPSMEQTCCPQYPIRCNALEFKIKKSQKKIIKRVNRFLNTGIKPNKTELDEDKAVLGDHHTLFIPGLDKTGSKAASQDSAAVQGEKSNDVATKQVPTSDAKYDAEESKEERNVDAPGVAGAGALDLGGDGVNSGTSRSKAKKIPRPGQGADPSKPRCKKAKLIRKERRLERASKQGETCAKEPKRTHQEGKSLEELLNDISDNPAHKLEITQVRGKTEYGLVCYLRQIRLVRSGPPDDEFGRTLEESHAVYFKYQLDIHKDVPTKPVMKQFKRFLCNSPLQIKLIRNASGKFDETVTESYGVYKKYQMEIHKDPPEECDRIGYKRFLCDSPLQHKCRDGGFPDGFGSFHQQYILDGKIIAVGVIDILPHCTSSVYLYYDPEYYFLSLGNYSALREIAFTRHLHTMEPAIRYYYMGFYIHSCPKMRYKGKYDPSFLNCPQTYGWYPIAEAALKLDANKFSRFAAPEAVDENGEIELGKVLVLHERQPMPYMIYRVINSDAQDEAEVTEYARLTGKTCAERMLLYRA